MHDRIQVDPGVFVAGSLTLCMWNSASLFGTLLSTGPRQTAKRTYLDTLLAGSTVVGVVEARGTAEDLAGLPATHKYYGSFAARAGVASSRCGGVFLALDKRVAEQAMEVRTTEHMAGRAITLSILMRTWNHFTLVHVDSACLLSTRRRLFHRISAFHAELQGPKFLMGDRNFVHPGDRASQEQARSGETTINLQRHSRLHLLVTRSCSSPSPPSGERFFVTQASRFSAE